MTTPLIDRLNILVKQLFYLNEILGKNLEVLPDKISESFIESVNVEISGIKQKLMDLHFQINKVMTNCYYMSLDAVTMKCNAESKWYLNKNEKTNNNKQLTKENK